MSCTVLCRLRAQQPIAHFAHRVIHASVGQRAIHIQDQQADRGEG
jgi:hypothetical protein